MERYREGFFAYPSEPHDLVSTIESASARVSEKTDRVSISIWPKINVFGASIPDKIRDRIRNADFFVCDITRANPNVYYEAGFAIGLGKPIAPVLNVSFANATSEVKKDGLFDNIGYKTYENALDLAEILCDPPTANIADLHSRSQNFEQPLFLLDSLRKTDFRNAIVSTVKESRVFFRSFDPVEEPRLSTVYLINELTSSSGSVIPLLPLHVDDAQRHNLRAAFVAGLSHGLDRKTLLIQRSDQDSVIPADYREHVLTIRSEAEIVEEVRRFANEALLATQSIRRPDSQKVRSNLQNLRLGAHSAENEFRTLENYFVETSEYLQTLRGEINVVAGRKGSGKTAIFFQVRDRFRANRKNTVTDLKPDSHQLSLFREELLKLVSAGVYDHTLAAFWYFLILSEVLLTIKKNLEIRARNESKALNDSREIGQILSEFQIEESGDFTTRINRLGKSVIDEIGRLERMRQSISPDRLTNIVFRGGIPQMRDAITRYSDPNGQIILLFDNIDKGWPTQGIHEFDVRLVRLLIEAMDKIGRDFSGIDRSFVPVVFLRNDIYELLVDQTPDRGKAGQIRIDWTDRAKLKQLVLRRLQHSASMPNSGFNIIWDHYFERTVHGRDAFDYLVDHCLMRPRFLINIIHNAVANAINRNHDKVSADDMIDAVRQHSNYLVGDFGYEIRDASGISADILYTLIGVEKYLTKEDILAHFSTIDTDEKKLEEVFRLLLWYGVIGVRDKAGREHFIYDHDYNAKRLDAEIKRAGQDVLFVTNAALHVGLAS